MISTNKPSLEARVCSNLSDMVSSISAESVDETVQIDYHSVPCTTSSLSLSLSI